MVTFIGVVKMDTIPVNLIFLLFFLLCLSAFFSSAETAFSSANKIRLKNYADEERAGGKKAYYITQHFDHALSTILIGNNLVNIAAATIAAKVASDLFGENPGLLISTIVMTILVLIFGEVLPKSFAKDNAEPFALRISGILIFLMKVVSPITWILVQFKLFLASLRAQKNTVPSITEEELKEMVNISEEEGILDNNEKELLHKSLEFNDIKVMEILTPRTDIVAIDVEMSIEQITSILLTERYSRVPVFEGNTDNIIGILSEREFLSALVKGNDINIKELMRKPIFVIESMRIASLLPILQKQRVHMAIVIDEFGGTSGLITLEDILEEIVGEIWDEHDDTTKTMTQIDQNVYEFTGDYPLDDFARLMNVELPDSTYHILGGWLVEVFQKVPSVNDEITYEHLTIRITEAEDRRIRKVIVIVNEDIEILKRH